MKRRSFLAMLGLAPIAAVVQPEVATGGETTAGGLIRWRTTIDGPVRSGFAIEARPYRYADGVLSVGRISFNELRSADGKTVMRPGSFGIRA